MSVTVTSDVAVTIQHGLSLDRACRQTGNDAPLEDEDQQEEGNAGDNASGHNLAEGNLTRSL